MLIDAIASLTIRGLKIKRSQLKPEWLWLPSDRILGN